MSRVTGDPKGIPPHEDDTFLRHVGRVAKADEVVSELQAQNAELRAKLSTICEGLKTIAQITHWDGNQAKKVRKEALRLLTAVPDPERVDSLSAKLCAAREALTTLYDAWENGVECYTDPEECSGYLGRAFKLSEADEERVLLVLESLGVETILRSKRPELAEPAPPCPHEARVKELEAAQSPCPFCGHALLLHGENPEDHSCPICDFEELKEVLGNTDDIRRVLDNYLDINFNGGPNWAMRARSNLDGLIQSEIEPALSDELFAHAEALKDKDVRIAELEHALAAEQAAHAETKSERDALAAAFVKRGHRWECPATIIGHGSGPCDCGMERGEAILTAHDAEVRRETLARVMACKPNTDLIGGVLSAWKRKEILDGWEEAVEREFAPGKQGPSESLDEATRIDCAWIAGAKFGWNCGVADNRRALNDAINARMNEIVDVNSATPMAAGTEGGVR